MFLKIAREYELRWSRACKRQCRATCKDNVTKLY